MILSINPIGYVETEHSDEEVSSSWPDGVRGRIIVYPAYAEGLLGLKGFSHIIALAWLHKVSDNARKVLKVRFRRFVRAGIRLEELPEVGVFCSDSPHRPNPIAITILRLEKIEHNVLHVSGLDLYNGTPILDLRAYTPTYSITSYELPAWYEKLLQRLKSLGERSNERRGGLSTLE